jgi:hypothetical protein
MLSLKVILFVIMVEKIIFNFEINCSFFNLYFFEYKIIIYIVIVEKREKIDKIM